MNEILFWGLIGISSLQATTSFSMVEPYYFDYSTENKYSVIALGIPDPQKTRNKDQIFILGSQNPFFVKNKMNALTLSGPTKVVLASDANLTLQDVEKRIKDQYGVQVTFSPQTILEICGLRLHGQRNLYCNLQDAQLKEMNFISQSRKRDHCPCTGMVAKL